MADHVRNEDLGARKTKGGGENKCFLSPFLMVAEQVT